ncbi:MAG: SDR family oxidoreductase [bacterium]
MDSVIVTGSGTGLGRETSLHLAGRGFAVYATVLNDEQARSLEAAARERKVSGLRVLPMDITDRASIESATETVLRETGGIYGLVNNAGIGLRGFFEDLAEPEIRRLFDTNVFGTMAVTRTVLPHMRAAGRGRIVMVTSIGGRIGSLAVSTYCATKFAQEGFGESLYQELLPLGIRVVLIEPAIVNTERWGIHRGVARGAQDPASPYHRWFQREEALASRISAAAPTQSADVARAIHRALAARRPKLRYMVGKRARLVFLMRRYLPEPLFDRVYFGGIVRYVTRSS